MREYLGIALDMEKNIFLRKRLIDTLISQRDRLGIPNVLSPPVRPQEQQADHMQIAMWNRYHEAVTAYHLDVARDKARLLVENRERTLLDQEIGELVHFQGESEDRLEQIYGKNIIFPKYRNFVALSSLYEYICAGRCYALEGPEGAYNIYEAESRFDKIVTQLDKVIIHLDTIRDNQFTLFSAMQAANQQYEQLLDAVQALNQKGVRILESMQSISSRISEQAHRVSEQTDSINRQAAQISSQLSELQKTSALSVYHEERTQKELHYMNRMDFWSGRNDGVLFNTPP